MVSRLYFTPRLLYHPTVCRGSLQVVTALFCAIEILHVRVHSSILIIRTRWFYPGEADSLK